ncbi:MAG: hypothetical protein ACLSVX_06385 [Massilimicrobiota timonensis]
MEEVKTFKYRINTATIIFLAALVFYTLFTAFTQDLQTVLVIGIFTILCFAVFIGMRPYKYSIEKKELTIHYALWKNSHVDLMHCETICDPVPRWADLVTRPHAIEIYTDTKKRYCFFPKERVEFVHEVVKANKRIHCTVKEYTDVYRILEKKDRKERRKAEKKAAKEARSQK